MTTKSERIEEKIEQIQRRIHKLQDQIVALRRENVGPVSFDLTLTEAFRPSSIHQKTRTRLLNALENANILLLGELVQRSRTDLICYVKNCGWSSVKYIDEEFERLGLHWSMDVEGWQSKGRDHLRWRIEDLGKSRRGRMM